MVSTVRKEKASRVIRATRGTRASRENQSRETKAIPASGLLVPLVRRARRVIPAQLLSAQRGTKATLEKASLGQLDLRVNAGKEANLSLGRPAKMVKTVSTEKTR